MTTSTTDAEAIARDLNGATSLVIEQMHEAGMPICMREGETTWRTYYAGFDLSLFAQRITDACCDAILSYLASRREAQEPVPGELLPCPFCGSAAEIERYGTPSVSTVYRCTECACRLETGEEWNHGAYWNRRTAPPAPAGEVERSALEPVLSFLDELAANGQPGERKVLNPVLIGGSAKLYAEGLRAALNGGRE